MWVKRSVEVKEKERRVYTVKYSNVDQILRGLYPGMRASLRRQLCLMRLKACVTALAEAYDAGSGAYQEGVRATQDHL